MHESQRSWFPFILAGLTVLLTAAFLVAEQKAEQAGEDNNAETSTYIEPAVTDDSYQSAVTAVLSTYATAKDAKAAYDALIVLRVPPSMQALHFDLVVAFGKALGGDDDEALARLAALKAQHPWLPL